MADRDGVFYEDMGKRVEWFRERHGGRSLEELHQKWNRALAHVEVLREARKVSLDPGGGKLRGEVEVLEAAGVHAKRADNPDPRASENFVTHAFVVEQEDTPLGTALKIKPDAEAGARTNLPTATVFRWDSSLGQWNPVEHSGYNAEDGYIWARIPQGGTFAAIALPPPEKARKLALERFAYYHMEAGLDAGILARPAEYFDPARFEAIVAHGQDLTTAKGEKRLADLKKLHAETIELAKDWRRSLPLGGLPEWKIIERALDGTKPIAIESLGISDLVRDFPVFFYVDNRIGRWYRLGPDNVHGRVKSLAMHPDDGDILYAGAANGGVWKTNNGGATWRQQWKFEDTMAVGAIAVAPSRPDTVYAATGEDTVNWGPSYGGAGIYKSTDGGGHWTQKTAAVFVGTELSRLVVHPTNPDVVWVAGISGVFKTTNGGDRWDLVLGGHATDLVIRHDQPDTLYAGVHNDGIYKTTTGGGSGGWSRITGKTVITLATLIFGIKSDVPTGATAAWITLAIGRNGPNGSQQVAVKLGKDSVVLLISTDGGASWFGSTNPDSADYDEWCSLVAIHPNQPQKLWTGGVGLSRLAESGGFQATTGTHSDHHQMVFSPTDDRVVWVCCDGGVYRSIDTGMTFQVRSGGIVAAQLMSMGVSDGADFLVGCATQDQGIIQTEGPPTWNDFGGGNEWGMFVVDPNDSRNTYISPGGESQLRRSRDRGRTYVNPTNGLTENWAAQGRRTRPAGFSHLAVQPGNSQILIGACSLTDEVKDAAGNVTASYPTRERIYYSSNQGTDWSVAANLTTPPVRVAYAPSDANRAYAATNDGRLYRSEDSGQTWDEPYEAGGRPPIGNITCIAVDARNPDRLFITYSNFNPHVHRSIDGGETFTQVSGMRPDMSLPDIAANSLVIERENRDILYVATDLGVFRSNDGGGTWYFYHDATGEYDLPKVLVSSLGVHRASRRLFAATMGRGLYYTYTTGFRQLRIVGFSKTFRGRRHPGIQFLRVTDGSTSWTWTRAEVIQRIEAGTNFYTLGADGIRAQVRFMLPDGNHPIDYLKTDPDETTANNLLSLTEFYM